jgi:REP element-mobilizing transposase RayT
MAWIGSAAVKQRHSFTHLLFHVVLRTKNREHLILSESDEGALFRT